MVSSKKMRNDKLNTKQFFIYHVYDFMFFTDLDNTLTRSRALGWLFDPALQLTIHDFLYFYYMCAYCRNPSVFENLIFVVKKL